MFHLRYLPLNSTIKQGKVNVLREYFLNSILHLREYILKSYKQNATVIVNRITIGIATADCTVKCHNRYNSTVNLLCGFGFICFDISGATSSTLIVVLKSEYQNGLTISLPARQGANHPQSFSWVCKRCRWKFGH